ncbi:MAG: GNAT family N-acetyltransferase [Nocardioidaceae bacterium]
MPTEFEVRRATVDDVGDIAGVFLSAREEAYPAMPRPIHSAESVHAYLARAVTGGREVWVAEAGGSVVGYLLLDPAWLDSVYVRPEHQGRGVGSALLDLAKSLRPEGFGLWVFEANEPARGFYVRRGLVEVRRTDGSGNEEREPDVEMAWLGDDPVRALRRRIDRLDDELAEQLDVRTVLAGLIQRFKAVPGHAGRDAAREGEIVARMAERAPHLTPAAIAAIMREVIAAGLDAAD